MMSVLEMASSRLLMKSGTLSSHLCCSFMTSWSQVSQVHDWLFLQVCVLTVLRSKKICSSRWKRKRRYFIIKTIWKFLGKDTNVLGLCHKPTPWTNIIAEEVAHRILWIWVLWIDGVCVSVREWSVQNNIPSFSCFCSK